MNPRNAFFAVAPLFCLGACAFTPASVALTPSAVQTEDNVGQNTPVAFRFVDDRDDVVVGHRSMGDNGAKISAPDLPKLVEAKLREGLEKKHFILVPDGAPAPQSVTYRIRAFKFGIEEGFFTGGQNAAASIAVDASRGISAYQNVYRYNDEERIMVVPTESAINTQMNTALDAILIKAFADQKLYAFLKGAPS